MGYTHFDKVDGVNGVYAGAKGSEVQIANSSGVLLSTAGVSIPTAESVHVNVMPVTTGAATVYIVAPVSGTVSGYTAHSVSAGTGRLTTVSVGSAGAVLLETAVTGANGTIGVPVVMTNTSGTTTITAGSSMSVAVASCATAQVSVGVTLTFTPTV